MYDDLIKAIRQNTCHFDACGMCPKRNALCLDRIALQAADAIEELSKPRWIPVTERLPEEGEFVLVYGDFYPNKHDGGVIAVSKRMDWNYWKGFGREIDITHWMPLPSTEGLNET